MKYSGCILVLTGRSNFSEWRDETGRAEALTGSVHVYLRKYNKMRQQDGGVLFSPLFQGSDSVQTPLFVAFAYLCWEHSLSWEHSGPTLVSTRVYTHLCFWHNVAEMKVKRGVHVPLPPPPTTVFISRSNRSAVSCPPLNNSCLTSSLSCPQRQQISEYNSNEWGAFPGMPRWVGALEVIDCRITV